VFASRICVPVACRCSGLTLRTAPCVPTGMYTGVRRIPRASSSVVARAIPTDASTVNGIARILPPGAPA